MMMMMILTGCCLARAAREHGPYPPSSVTNGMMLIVLAMGRRRRTTGPGLATRHTTVSLCLSLSSYTALFHYILMTVLVCRTSSRLVPVLLCCANSLCQSVSRRGPQSGTGDKNTTLASYFSPLLFIPGELFLGRKMTHIPPSIRSVFSDRADDCCCVSSSRRRRERFMKPKLFLYPSTWNTRRRLFLVNTVKRNDPFVYAVRRPVYPLLATTPALLQLRSYSTFCFTVHNVWKFHSLLLLSLYKKSNMSNGSRSRLMHMPPCLYIIQRTQSPVAQVIPNIKTGIAPSKIHTSG